MSQVVLRLGHSLRSLRPTAHNGPGWRIGLWVQGCRLQCTDRCLNPGLLAAEGGHPYTPHDVAAEVLRVASSDPRQVEGVTVLGGEPTEQALALLPVLQSVREAGLTTMVYSGHTLASLRRRHEATLDALLGLTDVLVDGPFIPKLYDDTLAWRGSRNQQLHCLSQRYNEAELSEAFVRQRKGFSIAVERGRILSVSGLQERAGAADIEAGIVSSIIEG